MFRWLLALAILAAGSAAAQTGGDVNQGLNSDGGAMSGATIDRTPGMNANGTPKQLSPGSSMTDGAGNSTMTPGLTGPVGGPAGSSAPPLVITKPTINGQASPPGQ